MKYDLEYVLDSALDGVFIVARDRRLVLFNRACEELYGIFREDLVNKACWKLSELKDPWKVGVQGEGRIAYGELAAKKERMVLSHRMGKTVWVETIYTPIFDRGNGEIAYVMGVIKDIDEQKQLEEERERLLGQLGSLRKELELKYDFSKIMGRSQHILQVMKLAGEVAGTNTTVLLSGESGTGKELLARAIHYNSHRAGKPFVAINCSAFPDTLIESELFGYEKGAFTGAEKSKPGKIQLAAGGTLFLDEVTELSVSAQVKLLRVIQEREFEPLGGVASFRADIRIIAASNESIQNRVREGRFREDLYYRLFVYPIHIPPLRERIEDIPVLIDEFVGKWNREMGRQVRGLTPEAKQVFLDYGWPGNIRELQNVIERLMILSKGEVIGIAGLPEYLREKAESRSVLAEESGECFPKGFSLEGQVEALETQSIIKALRQAALNKTRAAELLGLTRSTFRYKLSRIPAERLRSELGVNIRGSSA